jgi:hypothetical protein
VQGIYAAFRFGITNRGFMAHIPRVAEKGDIITVLLGAKTPFYFGNTESPTLILLLENVVSSLPLSLH